MFAFVKNQSLYTPCFMQVKAKSSPKKKKTSLHIRAKQNFPNNTAFPSPRVGAEETSFILGPPASASQTHINS